jgi:FkbM family methyltransferase
MDLSRWRRAWRRRVSIPLRGRVAPETTIQLPGRRMRVDLRDYPIGQSLYLDGSYEPALERLMRHTDLGGSVCLDIGANIGVHTLTMSELVGPTGRVYAFEPEAHNHQLLEQNLRLNGVTNVELRRCVVSDREGVCQIRLSPINYGDHRVAAAAPDSWQIQAVPMTTADASLKALPRGAVRFAKIDVQGHEPRVLAGMSETLDRNPDLIMVIEVDPDRLVSAGTSGAELVARLYEQGFAGWELHEHRIIPAAEPWVYDLITGAKWVDLVLSRNAELLRGVMSSYCGVELPRTA